MAILKNKSLFTPYTFLCICAFISRFLVVSASESSNIFHHLIDLNDEDVNSDGALSRWKRTVDVTDVEGDDDAKCQAQQMKFDNARKGLEAGKRLETTHVFMNESKYNLMLAWASKNDEGGLLVLTTRESKVPGVAPTSTLWQSKNHGRNWTDISEKLENQAFRQEDGLQRNPYDPEMAYLISYSHYIYVTDDGGDNWRKSSLAQTQEDEDKVEVADTLVFHSEEKHKDYVAVVSQKSESGSVSRMLHLTYDNFNTSPKVIQKQVHAVKWGTKSAKSENCLYATVGDFKDYFLGMAPTTLDLQRYCKTGGWKTILSRVTLFDIQGKFMYATVYKNEKPRTEEDDKLMMISSDGGETWNEAQLPTITGDRFYSVVDMSEGLIFMHVDNPGDTGHGTLYTSSGNGLIYSESLQYHLYPNYNTVHDFYKIESIRGVYLASQMSEDKSIHTVITYNRGGEWKNVTRPVGEECKNSEKEGCFLQIHNAYSIHRKVQARLPHSTKSALGIVLVHGHVASNLQTTNPDVFLSTDGGYNFRKVLTGPHVYEIADSGGLLVAVPMETYPKTIKFSTDEGHCWHVYEFTKDPIKFTGLLTEPGGKSMTVSLWGYHKDTKKWTVNVIDFTQVIPDRCHPADDYDSWVPHTSLSKVPGREGCLLGKKETFKRIKSGSWCRNGYAHLADSTEEKCTCSEEDYECDFGFYRPPGSTKCIRQPEIKTEDIEICVKGEVEDLESVGYRLIPGDECNPENGFKPKHDVLTDLHEICKAGDKEFIQLDETVPKKSTGTSGFLIFALVAIVLIGVAFIGAYFTYKLVLLRRHKIVYRYSMLNQGEGEAPDEFENSLVAHDTLYRDSSDEEEVEQENKSPSHNQPNGSSNVPVRSYHDDSDDDMLG